MKSIKMFGKSVPLLAIVITSLLVIGASAGILTYYGSIGGTVTVKQAVLVDGKGVGDPIVEVFGDVTGGDTVCKPHFLENLATIPAPVSFGTAFDPFKHGITVKYLEPVEYSFTATVGDQPVDIDVTDDGTHITWTIDYPLEAPFEETTEGNGQMTVGLVIALDGDGEGPAFQIHNNDGSTLVEPHGTWMYGSWGPAIDTPGTWFGWPSHDLDVPVTGLDWVTCSGEWKNADNPDGIFTISIDKSELGLCATDFHWALNLAIGTGFVSTYLTYEQMSCPVGVTDYFDWTNPIVNDAMPNYESATIANEITGVTLEAGELFDFTICYTFPLDIAGDYTITTTVDVA